MTFSGTKHSYSVSRSRPWHQCPMHPEACLHQNANVFSVNEGELKDWNRIAKLLPGRTNKDCRKRWSKVSNLVNKGMWTTDEDRRLEAAVAAHGSK